MGGDCFFIGKNAILSASKSTLMIVKENVKSSNFVTTAQPQKHHKPQTQYNCVPTIMQIAIHTPLSHCL